MLGKFAVRSAALSALLALAGACGGGQQDPSPEGGGREVDVVMRDNAFDPAAISASAGETVTFRFTNEGAVAHDAFIGDAGEQQEHGEAMDAGHMEGHNMDGSDALLLEPGESGELTYTFDRAGEIVIGCHQPGHYEAGMKSTITVI